MKQTIDCPSCHGEGRIPLPDGLRETLNALPRRGTATAADLHPKISDAVTINAVSNRLKDLLTFGLVTRTRRGKFWDYSRA